MARLRIEFSGTRTVVAIRGAEISVGRSNRCSIHLPDPDLAEVHFRIQKKARGYRLKDDGSGIGTRVNGKPVFATTLRHGDVIEAGGLRCVFLEEAAEVLVAIPVAEGAPPLLPRLGVPGRHTPGQIALLAAAGILALAVAAWLLLRTPADEQAYGLWNLAQERIDESRETSLEARGKLGEAARLLETIRRDYSKTRIAGTAQVKLSEVRRALKAFERLESERAFLERRLDDAAELAMRGRLRDIRRVHHPAIDAEVEQIELDLDDRRRQKLDAIYGGAEERAREHFTAERYAAAAKSWAELEVADYFMTKRIREAHEAVLKRISAEYRARLRLAARNADLEGRIGLLEACRPLFKGTRHASDLEVRISAMRARLLRAPVVVLRRDRPKKPPTDEPAQPPEQPEELPPYADPPKVAELLEARRYAEAASVLHSISRHPDAKVRIEELTLMASVMADLVAAVGQRPADFTQVLLPDNVGRGDAVGADALFLKIQKDGKRTQYAWDSLPAKSFVRLFRQAGFGKPPRLGVALFFDEHELPREAQKHYVAFFRSELAPTTLARVLARRRGVEAPKEGFLLFRGQIITREEKDGILLRERIAKLGKQALSTTERRRLAAWEELEKLGEPALEMLVLAVKARLTAAAGELKSGRAFTPSRFVARYGAELQRRRKHALAFLLDAKAYPYPNKSDSAQKEAERRVDAVRELYERPFAKLLEASESAQQLDKEVRDLDARLARLDPLGEPRHETVVEEITKTLDMRMVAIDDRDRRRIEYNVAVEKYNRELKTSADTEERANVTAVNEYRWMMGLHGVKIDERLVRAARKHSIEMQQRKYFAHDSPTKHLKTPGMRCKREGYGGGVSENIARGASTGRGVFWQWFRSSGHHRNMLLGHTDLGCGSAAHHWWTQNFGRLTGKSLTPPDVPDDPDPPGTSGNGMPPPDQGS